MIVLILLIAAAVLAFLATIGVGHPRINLLAAAFFAFVLSVLLPAIGVG